MTKYFLNRILILVLSCSSSSVKEEKNIVPKFILSNEFNAYWYQGKAEITHYKIEQARYGEIRSGDAILVFVTEDFLTDKQVKKEKDQNSKFTSVLKVNFIKRFVTGIYDYSMMSSVFTPVNISAYPNSLKVTNSNQDWCGQTFTQLNMVNNKYSIKRFSYFEDESDEIYETEKTFLEDEICTRIRIAAESLPVGKIKIIPSTMISRLMHFKPMPIDAVADISENPKGQKVYTVNYPSMNRTLKIFFTKTFPYSIEGWEESYKDGFGDKATMLTSKGEKIQTVITDYWKKNSVADSLLRKQLGLQ